MTAIQRIWPAPEDYLRRWQPDGPVLFFAPDVLRARYRAFRRGFPGLVSYAVKANPDPVVLRTLAEAGMTAFDVASLTEIAALRAAVPGAVLHYNNPVRSVAEITAAVAAGVRSFSVDRAGELEKLAGLCPRGETEVSVRFKLPVAGAAYDLGSKFGAPPDVAARLLARASELGFYVSLGFHPGTQCADPAPWASYIWAAAQLASGNPGGIARLNLGGGWPGHRRGAPVPLERFFTAVSAALAAAFPPGRQPEVLCEPGRAMISDAMTLALRVKSRSGMQIFLNDGIYGSLAEFADIGPVDRIRAWPPRDGPVAPFEVFGPTCDSLDRLTQPLVLPQTLAEGDYLLFSGMGAYSVALATGFNGYGRAKRAEVAVL